jgi:hypothetical protein
MVAALGHISAAGGFRSRQHAQGKPLLDQLGQDLEELIRVLADVVRGVRPEQFVDREPILPASDHHTAISTLHCGKEGGLVRFTLSRTSYVRAISLMRCIAREKALAFIS